MQKIAGLEFPPVFNPVVDDYYKGMATTLMLHNRLLNGRPTAENIAEALAGFYAGQSLVSVVPFGGQEPMLSANKLAGRTHWRSRSAAMRTRPWSPPGSTTWEKGPPVPPFRT